jgi:carboxypeptidase family protein/PDZ domain-containing protein
MFSSSFFASIGARVDGAPPRRAGSMRVFGRAQPRERPLLRFQALRRRRAYGGSLVSASAGKSRAATVLLAVVLSLGAAALSVRLIWPTPKVETPTASTVEPTAPGEDRTPEIVGKVADANGNPVRNAAVRVVLPRAPYTVLRETTCDGSGAFSFADLDADRVLIVADHDPEGFGSSAELDVGPGRTQELTLVLSATSGVTGTVVDARDRPVVGATLSITGVPWRVPSATTDAAGVFRLIIVPDQATSLLTVASGYKAAHVALEGRKSRVELVVRIQLAEGAPIQGDVHGADGEPVSARIVACAGLASEVAATSAADGSFELPPKAIGCQAIAQMSGAASSEPVTVVEGSPLHLRLRAGGAIEGVVVDDRGAPVPSFSIGIESFVSAKSVTAFGSFMQPRYDRGPRAFEDVRGAFRWDKLLPGDYVLTASVRGRPPARSVSIQVDSGIVARGVRIVLAQGGSVMGRIFDEHQTPIGDVEVAFDAVSSIAENTLSTKSDSSGRYRLDGAPAGPFTLRARKGGYRTHMLAGLRVASGSTLTEDLRLAPDDGTGRVELGGIGAGLSISPEGIIVSGVGADDPAARAGLQPGDRLVSIDGESSEGMSVADAIQRLRGEAGTSVGVSVEHPITRQVIDVVIVRSNLVHQP